MNVSDSERLASGLKSLGLEKSNDEESDLVVINTCVVRQTAEDTTTGFLGKLKKIKAQEKTKLEGETKHTEIIYPFKNYNLRKCAAGLWGRQILNVSFSNNVAIAYNASGGCLHIWRQENMVQKQIG